MGFVRTIFLGCAALFSLGSCGGAPAQFDLRVGVIGEQGFAYNTDIPWADRGADVELTFVNETTSPGIDHGWVLVDPDDGRTLASIDAIGPGQTATVHFLAPVPSTLAGKDYPFHCTVPGHTETGFLHVPSTTPRDEALRKQ